MNTIIYCLTNRGIYSELINLSLAIYYANVNNKKIIINTKNWNLKIKNGWGDYFESDIPSTNSIFTAQITLYSKEKPKFEKIKTDRKYFVIYYKNDILNFIYKLFHPNVMLARDIFFNMRSRKLINKIITEKGEFEKISNIFKAMYKLNEEYIRIIDKSIEKIGIKNKKYIGVHIRRGDKISTNEMNNIKLRNYLEAIRNVQYISTYIYIATDDMSIIKYFQANLDKRIYKLFYNTNIKSNGFNEAKFNESSKSEKKNIAINTFIDVEILIHSNYFIGTFSSNLSKIIPFYIGIENCKSLDKEWSPI